MDDRSGRRLGIFGMSGSGKSHFAKKMIIAADRIICFDPEDEYGSLKGFVRLEGIERLDAYLRKHWRGSFRIAYVPVVQREEIELHNVSMLVMAMQEPFKDGKFDKKVTLLADELNTAFPLNPKPENNGFANVCSRGRKRGINVIGISQRPAEIAMRFRGNLDELRCFRLATPHDVKAVDETPMGAGKVSALLAGDLPAFAHISCSAGGVKVEKPVT
jgi:hypothetical protein